MAIAKSWLIKRHRDAIVLATLLATLFIAALDFSAITTALPSIAKDLQSQAAYAWIGSAYLLTSAAVAPVWGRVSDAWGQKAALMVCVAIFFVGSTLCASSQSTVLLICGRAIQGCGAGGIIVSVNISITALVSVRSRGFALSTTGLVWALSSGVGPLLGGAISQHLTWRWLFWINLPVCLVAFVLIALLFDSRPSNSPTKLRDLDWIGSVAVIGAAVMILLSLDFGGAVSPWNSSKVLGPLVGGVVLFGSFLLWEAKGAREPVVPLRLLSSWTRVAPLLVCFTHGFVNVSSWYFLPIYFQAALDASPTRSGALLLPIVLTQALIGVAAGAFIHRFSRVREIIWVGTALMTLGFGLFIYWSTSTSLAIIAVSEVTAGLGVGLIFQAPLLAYQSFVKQDDVNVATALFGFVRSLSTTCSVVLGETVFQNGMKIQQGFLQDTLSPELVSNFTAGLATSNALQVRVLAPHAQEIVKQAYVHSLQYMWIFYTSVSSIGLLIGVFMMPKISL